METQVLRQAIDYFTTSSLIGLPLQNRLPDSPIEQNQFAVYGDRGAHLRG
jgi:hypothetical protein